MAPLLAAKLLSVMADSFSGTLLALIVAALSLYLAWAAPPLVNLELLDLAGL